MSTSYADAVASVRAWRVERFPLALFGPAAATLTLAGVTGQPLPGVSGLAHRLALAGVALAGLRLWDDLADRERDARTHPHRVLALADPRPFRLVAAVLMALALALALALSWGSAATLGLLCAALAAYYGVRPGVLVLLLKYPALVLMLRGDPAALDLVGVGAMGVIYAAMVLDEYGQRRAVGMGLAVILLLLLGMCTT